MWGTLDRKEIENCKGCLVETMSSWLICISLLPLLLKHRNPVLVGHPSFLFAFVNSLASGLIISGDEDCFTKTWKDVVCVEA